MLWVKEEMMEVKIAKKRLEVKDCQKHVFKQILPIFGHG
jgi:hypothetical protein